MKCRRIRISPKVWGIILALIALSLLTQALAGGAGNSAISIPESPDPDKSWARKAKVELSVAWHAEIGTGCDNEAFVRLRARVSQEVAEIIKYKKDLPNKKGELYRWGEGDLRLNIILKDVGGEGIDLAYLKPYLELEAYSHYETWVIIWGTQEDWGRVVAKETYGGRGRVSVKLYHGFTSLTAQMYGEARVGNLKLSVSKVLWAWQSYEEDKSGEVGESTNFKVEGGGPTAKIFASISVRGASLKLVKYTRTIHAKVLNLSNGEAPHNNHSKRDTEF